MDSNKRTCSWFWRSAMPLNFRSNPDWNKWITKELPVPFGTGSFAHKCIYPCRCCGVVRILWISEKIFRKVSHFACLDRYYIWTDKRVLSRASPGFRFRARFFRLCAEFMTKDFPYDIVFLTAWVVLWVSYNMSTIQGYDLRRNTLEVRTNANAGRFCCW